MELRPGQKLRSAVSEAQLIVVRAPATAVEVCCGGVVERHAARPDFKPYHGLHVVLRVAPSVGSLRCRKMYKAMRDATITAALREWFRIVHISLQRTHVHLIIEG